MLNQHTHLTNKRYHDLLVRITHAMLNTVSEADFFTKVFEDIGQTTNASRVYLFERSLDGFWSNIFEWCSEGVDPFINHLQGLDETYKTYRYFFHTLLKGERHIYDDISLMPKALYDFLAGQDIRSIFVVPLYENDRVASFFGFDICKKPVKWQPEVIDIFVAMGNLLSSAIGHFHIKKQLEDQSREFQGVLDAFPDPIYISDMKTHELLFCNKVISESFPSDNIKDQPCYKRFQGLDEPCSFCTNERLEKENLPIAWVHKNLIIQRDLRVIDCCVEWQGRKKAHLSAAQDITELLEVKRCELVARESNVAKNAFLANMSHEFRTPLNGIAGVVRLAKEHGRVNNSDATMQDYLSKIHASTTTLSSLVNNLLDYLNFDSATFTLDTAPFSISIVLQNIIDTFEPLLEEKGLFVNCSIDDNLPQSIIGDVSRLTQVLMNLVSNSIKFTREGGITLDFCIHEKADEKITLDIHIKDTGIGIKKEKCETLFQAFSQVDASFTRDYGGAGMGLAISYKLIKLMGGDISVESVYRQGSVFTIRIPFCLPNNSEQAQEIPEPEDNPLRGTHILVTEDNEINQMIIEDILLGAGSVVDIANNGEQALAMVKKTKYNLVLMDIQMPVMDGITATKFIRHTHTAKQLPIIALTAHAMQEDKSQSVEAGMQGHITKPIDAKVLISILYKWINVKEVALAETPK